MIFTTLVPLLLAAVPAVLAQEDIRFDAEHNATSIIGTWASGSKQVLTGPGFANPVQMTFTYPKVTGSCYSFDGDGHYEISRYRFQSNGSEPTCIVGTMVWVHGHYEILNNGSIILTPFGDGYQQVQDPCAAVSNQIQIYNYTELMSSWRIFHDTDTNEYKLHLFKFDGVPESPLFQVSTEPNMLPTQLLRNVSVPADSTTKRDIVKRSAGERSWSPMSITGLVGSVLTVGMASLAL
jgi:hypothetical protein